MAKKYSMDCPDCGGRKQATLRHAGYDEDGNETGDVDEIEAFGTDILLSQCVECGHVKPRRGGK